MEPKARVAEFRVDEDALLDVGAEISADHFVAGQLVDVQGVTKGKHHGIHDVIAIEDFILREMTKGRTLLSPVRLTAILRFNLWQLGVLDSVVMQQPADAKSTITDKRMRDWGLWNKGMPHVNDAIRHLVLALRRRNG